MTRPGIAALVLAAFAAVPAVADCNPPGQAPVVPDGTTATLDQMKTAHSDVQSYVNLLQSYQDCVEAQIKLAPKGTKAETLQRLRDEGNAAIAQAEALQSSYKAQVTAYKARVPK
jgi:hypothetical protein